MCRIGILAKSFERRKTFHKRKRGNGDTSKIISEEDTALIIALWSTQVESNGWGSNEIRKWNDNLT